MSEELVQEIKSLRHTVQALITALVPAEEQDPAQDLLTVLSELAASVDAAAAEIATLRSDVSRLSREAPAPRLQPA